MSTIALKELYRNFRIFFFSKRQCDITETYKENNKSEVCYTLNLLISPHFPTTDTQPHILSHHPSLSLSVSLSLSLSLRLTILLTEWISSMLSCSFDAHVDITADIFSLVILPISQGASQNPSCLFFFKVLSSKVCIIPIRYSAAGINVHKCILQGDSFECQFVIAFYMVLMFPHVIDVRSIYGVSAVHAILRFLIQRCNLGISHISKWIENAMSSGLA